MALQLHKISRNKATAWKMRFAILMPQLLLKTLLAFLLDAASAQESSDEDSKTKRKTVRLVGKASVGSYDR